MEYKNLRNLSDRINYALKLTGISQAELARAIGVKPQTIHYLCSTQAESSKFTFELANALGINFEWLAVGSGDIELNVENPSQHNLNKNIIYKLDKLKELAYANPTSFLNNLKHPFELQLYDQSMWPRFPQGTLLIFEQKVTYKNGDFILVYLESLNDFVFRELIEKKSKKILVPFNSSLFKEVPLQSTDVIVGALVEARWRIER